MDRADIDRLHDLLDEIERSRAALRSLIAGNGFDQPPTDPDVDPDVAALAEQLRHIRSIMLANPAGSRAVVGWLAAEGRRFAATEQGREWRDRLVASPSLEHLRELWEATSVGVFDHLDEERAVPSAWIDLVHDLLTSHRSVDQVIDTMRPPGLA